MKYNCYCDDCLTFVSREHADSRKPCPKCGNTFYAIGVPSIVNPGATVFIEQRYEHMREYYATLEKVQSIRITGMSASDYKKFIEAGERNITLIQRALDESCEQDRRAGRKPLIPPSIPMPIKLPDMYMRNGHWDDAQRVYDFCKSIPYLREFDFDKLKAECEENRLCAAEIVALIEAGTTSQKAIRKALSGRFDSRPINYLLRYYRLLNRVKSGTDYVLNLNPPSELF